MPLGITRATTVRKVSYNSAKGVDHMLLYTGDATKGKKQPSTFIYKTFK